MRFARFWLPRTNIPTRFEVEYILVLRDDDVTTIFQDQKSDRVGDRNLASARIGVTDCLYMGNIFELVGQWRPDCKLILQILAPHLRDNHQKRRENSPFLMILR